MLRAGNLTVTVPSIVFNEKLRNPFCNKNCKYCVSVMTGFTERSGLQYMSRNIEKAKMYAERADVTSALITGKGETLLNLTAVEYFAKQLQPMSIEIQTNGMLLIANRDLIENLYEWGVDVVAISIDSDRDFQRMERVIEHINDVGMTTRITVNVSDKLDRYKKFSTIVNYANEHNIPQVLFRKLTSPTDSKSDEVSKWIDEHADTGIYEDILSDMNKAIEDRGVRTRVLNTGEIVWSVDKLSLVSIDYCVQETSSGEDIRSLIFHEDGHMYTQWNDDSTILF